MEAVKGAKQTFLIGLNKLLLVDLDKKFRELVNKIRSELKGDAVFVNKEINDIENSIKQALKKTDKLKQSAVVDLRTYWEQDDTSALSSLKRDLLLVAKSLRDLEAEFRVSTLVIIKDKETLKRILNSGIAKEIDAFVGNIEESTKELDRLLK